MKSFLLATLASSAVLLNSLASAAAPVYRLKAVPSPVAGTEIRGTSINSQGHVAGVYTGANNESHLFLYRNGHIQDLGVVAGYVSKVKLNDLDEIVGTGNNAFIWRHGQLKDLTPLGIASAQDINNRGQFTGRTLDDQAYRFTRGQVERIGTLGTWGEGLAINNRGQVTGAMDRPDDSLPHAFLYDNSNVLEIGPPYESYGFTINDRAQVGMTYFADFFGTVAIYHNGVTGPAIWSLGDPLSINNRGDLLFQIYRVFPGDPYGAIYIYKDSSVYSVTERIEPSEPLKADLFLSPAEAEINDRGQIVANGFLYSGGELHPGYFFILTPLPPVPTP
jgi:probable HAF family extracellular repeat protein